MKPTRLLILASLLAPAVAAAQPVPAYAPPPPPPGPAPYYAPQATPPAANGGFHDRASRLALGFSIGVGKMKIDDAAVPCSGCGGDPLSFAVDAHIGWMLSPRLALLFEAQGVGQTVADTGSVTDTLVQSTGMIAAQYWVSPQLWLKAGIGASQLSVTRDDGFSTTESDALDGGAIMGAIGYEVMSSRNFAIDVQARVTGGTYEDAGVAADGTTRDSQLGTTSVSLGFNWF